MKWKVVYKLYSVTYLWFFYQAPEVWGELYKSVWKPPKHIINMKWFKTLFTSTLYEIYFCFDFHHNNNNHMSWYWFNWWIPEIHDEIIEKHIKCPNYYFHQQDRNMIILNIYRDVVQVLRYPNLYWPNWLFLYFEGSFNILQLYLF